MNLRAIAFLCLLIPLPWCPWTAPHVVSADAARLPIARTTLKNGLRLLVLERHRMPLVACQLWYRVGSAAEGPGQTGLAHFLEHMLFKGTDRFKKGEIDKITQRLGGSNNASTSYDYTNYWFNFASDRWEKALEIEANRMRRCLFDRAEVEAERQVVIEELKRGKDDPWGKLYDEVEMAAFAVHPYHHPVIGFLEDLQVLPRKAFLDFYRTHYNPNTATLVIVGDVRAERVTARVRELFGPVPRRNPPPPPRVVEPPPVCEKRVTFARGGNVGRAIVGFKAPPRGHPDSLPLDVLGMVLGKGKTSRLYQRLVEKERLAASVEVDPDPRKDASLFTITLELLPGRDHRKAEAALLSELERVVAAPVTEAELAKARRMVAARFVFDQETAQGLAYKIGLFDTIWDVGALGSYIAAVESVGAPRVREVAGRILTEANRVVGWSLEAGAAGGDRTGPHGQPRRSTRARIEPGRRPNPPVVGQSGGARAISPLTEDGRAAGAGRAAVRVRPLAVSRFKLANGLRVFILEDHTLPAVAVEAFVDVDARFDPEERAGLAHFTGLMLTEGTARRDHLAIATAIEGVGGRLEAGEEGLSAHVLAPDLDTALDVVADCIARPAFPDSRVRQIKDQVLARIRAEADDPFEVGAKALREAVYGRHPYHHPAIGYEKTVSAITRQDLVTFHQRHYRPSNAMVAICGDVSVAAVREAGGRHFGPWEDRPVARPAIPEVPGRTAAALVALPMEKEQVNIFIGHPGIRRTNPDYYALLVMDHILGTSPGFTDRLSRVLRDEKGLCYTVYANFHRSAGVEPGIFEAYMGVSPENLEKGLAGILAEIRGLLARGVSDAELSDVRDYLIGSFVFKFETYPQLARYLVQVERYGLGDDYLARYPDLVGGVTAAEVVRVARKYLDPDRAATVVVGAVDEKGRPRSTPRKGP